MSESDSFLLDMSEFENDGQKTERVTQVYEFIRQFNNDCDQKKIKDAEMYSKDFKQILSPEIGNILSKPPPVKELKRQVTDLILERFCKECRNDANNLLFFAAATFKLHALNEIISRGDVDVNQLRNYDSVIVFALKYGNIKNDDFVSCMILLIEADVDINKFNYKGRTAIDYIATLYNENKNMGSVSEKLKNVAEVLLTKGIYEPENRGTRNFLQQELQEKMSNYHYSPMSDKVKLFNWLINCKTKEFQDFEKISKYANSDNCEDTLLQLACRRSDNMLPIVQKLLKNKADPNLCTQWNTQTPLEVAASRKNQRIFEEVLKDKRTKVTEKQYNNLVLSLSSKLPLFKLLLKSGKLDPNYRYAKNGNTPLHYAIKFSDKEAIQKLLKGQPRLLDQNDLGKCPLDMINAGDLETYLDSCLLWDNYSSYFSDIDYKMQLRFGCLIDEQKHECPIDQQKHECPIDEQKHECPIDEQKHECPIDEQKHEVRMLAKIANRPHLEHLLRHPLIHTFISLKWTKIKFYFKLIVVFQAFLFLTLSYLFYVLNDLTKFGLGFCILFTLINVVVKSTVFVKGLRIKKNRKSNQITFHVVIELLLVVTMIFSFFQNQFRAYIFVEMAISFLLTIGYHPQLSKWSVMLQKVFKTFTVLLLFFSLLVVAFAMGFHITFEKHVASPFYHNFFTSIFVTYVMTTGEYNLEKSRFDSSGLGGYLLFFLFTMSVCLVIVNFWTGVAVTDIERIEKRSEINSCKNVILFMSFIDNYGKVLECITRFRSPLLFVGGDNSDVDFYVNKDHQFGERIGFPKSVDRTCWNKLRRYHEEKKKMTNEQEILSQLKQLTKIVHDLQTKQNIQQFKKPLKTHRDEDRK